PMIDYIYRQLAAMPRIRRVSVVTNNRFAAQFADWAASHAGEKAIAVVNDGTTSDADKLGAIGDIRLTIQRNAIDDDLLVVAGDNLFDFPLSQFVDFFDLHGSCVGLYDTGDLAIMSQYATVELDGQERIVSFREKPRDPTSTLAATAIYLFKREHLALIERYAQEEGNMDAPGYYLQWLTKQVPVYGFKLPGAWRDIGNLEQYRQAQKAYRAR
ncbi:MAG: nucleotidyltransferase family protein, partial [Chloroflexota bacterium]|nr:nucleotidyltransferase family protein [Chloroflexota bacterium]